jgi:hypothetical protein
MALPAPAFLLFGRQSYLDTVAKSVLRIWSFEVVLRLIHEQHNSNPNIAVKSFLARSIWAGNLGACKRICSLMAQRGMNTY